MISRDVGQAILNRSKKYPVVSITGPRQSGKTTLAKMIFPEHAYVSLERPDNRMQAQEDPRRFLRSFTQGVILDEVQHVPDLFSYIQADVDESPEPGKYILTGSQNFLLLEKISQSLAGRVAIFKLLPFSLTELAESQYEHSDLDTYMFTGTYPPIYDREYDPVTWYMDYIQTYIERDVRSIRNVTDLARFQRFLSLCAGRVGQLLNLNALAGECGVTHNTAADWMAVLEASYLVFRLMPHYKNFNKRVVKQSKLYFFDSGLLCALLGLHNPKQLGQHYLRGSVFESFIVSELVKARWVAGFSGTGHFWRDHHGHEIDYLLETGGSMIPIEIKSGETIQPSMFAGLSYYSRLSGIDPNSGYLIYGGNEAQQRKHGKVLGWPMLTELLHSIMTGNR
ncbi:MAG TPA: ATP-binding protein [bacterium]|nr:ATP-binding protein [bacterium]